MSTWSLANLLAFDELFSLSVPSLCPPFDGNILLKNPFGGSGCVTWADVAGTGGAEA